MADFNSGDCGFAACVHQPEFIWCRTAKSIDAINSMAHVFVGPGGKFGRSTACAGHRIDTGDALPVRQRLRRVPLKRRQVIEDYLQDLLAQNCVRPSNSEWATPVVIVAKKDGAPRFCLDYRKLNLVTKKDAYPLPRIDDALDLLANKKYFCTLDLASGFYQLPMHPRRCTQNRLHNPYRVI